MSSIPTVKPANLKPEPIPAFACDSAAAIVEPNQTPYLTSAAAAVPIAKLSLSDIAI